MPSPNVTAADEPVIETLGDIAMLLRFEERIDVGVNARVHAAARTLGAAALPGIVDIVPAYATLTLVFDEALEPDPEELRARVRALLAGAPGRNGDAPARRVVIPVLYGGERGPDLATVAAHAGLSEEEVVRRHAAAEYTVAMLGFLPGFPYLLGLDPSIALPRRETPRLTVPAGSVAIGSAQTGIYPCSSPGGWHLIGHTPARLFDPREPQPALLAPGDRVRFLATAADWIDAARARIEQGAQP